MKYCVFCARPIDDDAVYCEECGQAQPVSVTMVDEEEEVVEEKKSRAPLLIILLSAGVVTMMAAVVLLAWGLGLFGGSDKPVVPQGGDSLADAVGVPTHPDIPDVTVAPTTEATTTTTKPPVKVQGDDTGVAVYPDELHAPHPYKVMAGGGLYMRAGPDRSYAKLQLVPDEATVNAYYTAGDWFYAEYNGAVGWMKGSYLIPITAHVITPSDDVEYAYQGYFRVTSSNGVNMRSGPDTSCDIVGGIPYNGDLEAHKRCGDWIYGKSLLDGTFGWVKMDYLEAVRE